MTEARVSKASVSVAFTDEREGGAVTKLSGSAVLVRPGVGAGMTKLTASAVLIEGTPEPGEPTGDSAVIVIMT